VRFDLGRSGLETVLFPWQAELMRFIWGDGEGGGDHGDGWVQYGGLVDVVEVPCASHDAVD